jgi:mono/diheme cytochrome c family protein
MNTFWYFRSIIVVLLVGGAFPTFGAEAAGNAEHGKELFARYGCYQCHQYSGAGFQGAPGGATLVPLRFAAADAFIAYIRNPPQANRMPPYTASVLSDADARDIHAWILTLPQPRPIEEIELLQNIVEEMQSAK